jgi:molybdate transport system ATP-binding protein
MDEILNLADQLVLLEDGRVVASGGIEPLMSRLDLRHIFGGSEYGAVFGTEVEDPEDEHGLASLRFPGGVLRVPAFGAKRGELVRVRIPAGTVALALERPERSSFQNIFPGSVEEIAGGDGSFLDVRLDIGCPLLARVTSRARADLGLTAGKRVHALVKSVAVSKGGFDA